MSNRATLENWQTPLHNRWAFWHVRELVPTEQIARGDDPPTELPYALEPALEEVAFHRQGRTHTFGEMLGETYTDAIVVVHGGRIVFERYADPGGPAQPHLLMSVSKSLTSALVGALVDGGALDVDAEIPGIIPRLESSSFEGATVQHLLDMRTGTRFDESDYEDPETDVCLYDEVCGLSARRHGGLPENVWDYIEGVPNAREHGGPFEYRSILTDLLGWVAAEAGGARFADLLSREIFSKLGPEQDAEIAVDPTGFPIANAGVCTTARDLARFGLLFLNGGTVEGRRVLSEEWVDRLRVPNAELQKAFAAAPEAAVMPGGFYHDCWWIRDAPAGIYAGEGINGQACYVHTPSDTVIAKFSTWPEAWNDDHAGLTEAGFLAVCRELSS